MPGLPPTYRTDTGTTLSELPLLSTLLAAISPEADLGCCTGGTHDLGQLFDKCPLFKKDIQGPTIFSDIVIMNLKLRQSYSVFGRIDFFSKMQFFVPCLGASLQME